MRHKLHIDTFMADSFFYFFIFLSFFFFTSALTFGGFSQLFPALFSVFFFYIFPPDYSCFVFLFLVLDFYGDSALPRNNGGWGIRRREGGWMAFS